MKFSEYYKKQWRLYLNKFWVCSFRNKVYNLILLLDVLAMYQHYKFDEEKKNFNLKKNRRKERCEA